MIRFIPVEEAMRKAFGKVKAYEFEYGCYRGVQVYSTDMPFAIMVGWRRNSDSATIIVSSEGQSTVFGDRSEAKEIFRRAVKALVKEIKNERQEEDQDRPVQG